MKQPIPRDLNLSVPVNPGNSDNNFKLLSVFALSELWYNLLLDCCMIQAGCALEDVEPGWGLLWSKGN